MGDGVGHVSLGHGGHEISGHLVCGQEIVRFSGFNVEHTVVGQVQAAIKKNIYLNTDLQ